jgi:hypothetical protein
MGEQMNKINEFKNIFIKETYEDTWDYYMKTLSNSISSFWDWIVITASNDEQARTYNFEIESRLKNKLLPSNSHYIVIADPDGKRVVLVSYIKCIKIHKRAF